jgi:hypothetical protein
VPANNYAGRAPRVAATVHEVQRYGLTHHRIEVTGVSDLNTQSPSERCDGDCALRPGEPIASRPRLGRACNRPSGTVAGWLTRLFLRLTRMGSRRTATGARPA